MGFLGTSKIQRAIDTLLTVQNVLEPDAAQAVKTLQGYGLAAIPKLLQACAKTRTPEPLIKVLQTFVRNETLPVFRKILASPNARMVAEVVEVLSRSNTYDPNLLLEFFTDPRLPKGSVGKLLVVHQRALDALALLRCLDKVPPQERPMLLSFMAQTATAAVVPALLQRLEHPDENVRLMCVQTLVRFPSEVVRTAFYRLLTDVAPMVRLSALDGLARLALPLDLKLLCQRLWDEHDDVRREVKKFLGRCKDPQLANYLFDILEDPSSEARTDAMELLGTIRDVSIIKHVVATRPQVTVTRDILLRLLDAPHTSARQVALVGLASVKSPFDVERICPLLWDPDTQIRRLAGAILTHYKVPQTLEALSRALKDDVSTVRQGAIAILNVIANPHIVMELLRALQEEAEEVTCRATEALAHTGGPQVIDAALQLMAEEEAFFRKQIHTILTLTENPAVATFLTTALTNTNPWVRRYAAEVLGRLGDRGREAVPALLEMAQSGAEEGVLALQALTRIGDPRALPVCLSYMACGTPALQQEALQALMVLTDAANFDVVLQSILALRDTVATEHKESFNHTAATILRRFPDRIVPARPGPLLLSSMAQAFSMQSAYGSVVLPAELVSLYSTQGSGDQGEATTIAASPGTILGGRYQVIRQIGEGGFGTAVLVRDTMVKEELVLKFLHRRLAADEKMVQRFIHELLYARRITHENVIRIHDFLHLDNSYAISMEYFPSHNLSLEVVAERFLTDVQRGFHILVSVCRGMYAAHQVGIVHRDLKPANILINDAGVVKVVDFGLAAAVTEAEMDTATKLTNTGAVIGTPYYMAPEQVQSESLDARADIYSLGIIMYEMFTGRKPYIGGNLMSVLLQHVGGNTTSPGVVNPRIPPQVEAIILKAMALEPTQRFQSMEEFEKSLLPFLR